MSLYGALFTGISGLAANSNALSATSNNIANVNTVGYKADQAQFSTLLTTTGSSNAFSAGGVRAIRQQNINEQGLIQASASSTDLAISGNGFFVVSRNPTISSGQVLYTRAGAFRPDGDGYLRNAAGLYLQGWQLDSNGDPPANLAAVGAINLNDLTGTAQPTDTMNLHANLQSSLDINAAALAATYAPLDNTNNIAGGGVTPDFERTVQVYDTQGGAQQLRLAFIKSAANTWEYEFIYDGDATDLTTGVTDVPIGYGQITFNSDGTIATVNGGVTGSVTLNIPFDVLTSGLDPQDITVNFGEPGSVTAVTQFDSPSTVISSGANGALFGGLSGVRVDEDGRVIAVFDNGVERAVYQLPVATFVNANGLLATSGNAFLQSEDSGEVSLRVANAGGAGSVAASALEASTVDLAKEFTDLITTQRAYSASTRIITTADEMLSELMQIKR